MHQMELSNTEHQDGKEEKKQRTCSKTMILVFNNTTVEPCVIMCIIPVIITLLTSQNLALEKACRVNLNYTDDICTALKEQNIDSQNQYERETEKLLASALAWKTYMTASIPCILGIFVGSYSDKTGHRKLFLTLPMIGQIFVCINNILNVHFFHELNLETFILVEGLIEALSGGTCIFVIIVFSFISAITTEETRTFRMGMVNFSLTVGFPIGMGLSGVLLKYLGYYGCYFLASGMHVINLLYTIFVVKDPARSLEQKKVRLLLYLIVFFSSLLPFL